MASSFSLGSLTAIIPQPIRALSGFRDIGQHDGSLRNPQAAVADAVYAVEQMALTAATFFALYKLTGGLSVDAVMGSKLKAAGVAALSFFASPATFQVSSGSFLTMEGGLRARTLYANVAQRALAAYGIAAAYLAVGLATLSKATPLRDIKEATKTEYGNLGLLDSYVLKPIASWASSKLVTAKGSD